MAYTRLMAGSVVHASPNASSRLKDLVRNALRSHCDGLRPRRIVVKPNWVLHETTPTFPIEALVTDARLIEAVVETCLDLFPDVESLLVGDCPLQWADWPLLCRQSGLTPAIDRLEKRGAGRVSFLDLRREVFAKHAEGFMVESHTPHGDPRGYREVALGARSHLEPLSHQARRFAVNDYSASVTSSNHAPGRHSYLVSQSVLDADLFINLPKWKSHQKSAITAALKNLVGINGDKAYLPHFRRGAPRWGGDEYGDEHRWLYWLQTTLREQTQKRSRTLFRLLKPGWDWIKRLRGIETEWKDVHATPRHFYVAGGAWHGNDTIWRMIYDLNLIIQCVDAQGRLHDTPQRHYFCLVDAITCGQGNGPLQPVPRPADWLVWGTNPFAIDTALTHFMGFDVARVPLIARRHEYLGPDWGRFNFEQLEARLDDTPIRISKTDINLQFAPPPGWKGHVER
jgi:uncharacterized protein (DUF362 family)